MGNKNQMPKHNPDFEEPIQPWTEQTANAEPDLDEVPQPPTVGEIKLDPIEYFVPEHLHFDPNKKAAEDTSEPVFEINWRKLKNTANAVPVIGQQITQPSKTIPDQSMTIQQILLRNQQGLSLNALEKVPEYDGATSPDDLVLPDLSKLDLADRQEILDQYEEMLKDVTERLKAKKQTTPTKDVDQSPIKDPQALEIVPPKPNQGT